MRKKLDVALLKAKWGIDRFMKEEGGMETLETVILIVVAVVIAGVVLVALQGEDGKGGLIHGMFDKIAKKIGELFGKGESVEWE